MRIATIGFTQKSASHFFGALKKNEIKTLFDVRTNNSSQLAGFAKKQDLAFFLKELINADYQELRDLCPDAILLKTYRSKAITWDKYADQYLDGLAKRHVERNIPLQLLDGGCLLCSEHTAHFCHRRLAVEYLSSFASSKPEIIHLI